MTAFAAKTKHRREWRLIHLCACMILNINPENDIDKFMSVSKFISDFTDKHLHPPRRQDFLSLFV